MRLIHGFFGFFSTKEADASSFSMISSIFPDLDLLNIGLKLTMRKRWKAQIHDKNGIMPLFSI